MTNRPSRRLHVLSGKGGVGKSTLGRAIAWSWQSCNLSFSAFDADGSNATLARFIPGTVVVDVDGDGQVHNWFEETVVPSVLTGHSRVLLDLGAGGERLFRTWSSNNDAPALLASEGVGICVWHLLDPSIDSISPLLDTMAAMPDVKHMVVFNLGLAKGFHSYQPEAAFASILQEPEFQVAAKDRTIIKLPPLIDGAKLDAADMDFATAIAEGSPLTIFEKMRVKKWLLATRDQVAPWL